MNNYGVINTCIHNYNNIVLNVIHLACLSKFTFLNQNPAVIKRLISNKDR